MLEQHVHPLHPLNVPCAGNHWWLTQDIHVVNATGRRDATVLLARSTDPGYDMHRATGHPLAAPTGPIARPVIFCTMKLVHEVIEEELPVQSGFHNIDVDLTPHNLHGFNPNILVRYQPEYNRWFENTFMESYVPPYASEYELD